MLVKVEALSELKVVVSELKIVSDLLSASFEGLKVRSRVPLS